MSLFYICYRDKFGRYKPNRMGVVWVPKFWRCWRPAPLG